MFFYLITLIQKYILFFNLFYFTVLVKKHKISELNNWSEV